MQDDPSRPTAAEQLQQLRNLTYVLDSLFEVPVIKRRVGLDGIIGLIPGIGDLFGLAISSYLVLTAARLQISNAVLARMIVNVGLDAAIGAVPLFGDLVDLFFPANRRNLALLERNFVAPQKTHRRSVAFLIGIVLALVSVFALMTWLVVVVIKYFWHAIASLLSGAFS